MKTSEGLRAGLEYFGPNGENWGQPAGPNKGNNGACLTTCTGPGAANVPLPVRRHGWKLLTTALGVPTTTSVWKWNDTPGRTFAEVRDKMLEAIALAEAEEKEEATS